MDEGGWRKVTEWQAALSFIFWLWFIVQMGYIVLWFGQRDFFDWRVWIVNTDVMIPELLIFGIVILTWA